MNEATADAHTYPTPDTLPLPRGWLQVCSVSKTRPIKEELQDVWAMVQRRSVLLPMLFVGVRYNQTSQPLRAPQTTHTTSKHAS